MSPHRARLRKLLEPGVSFGNRPTHSLFARLALKIVSRIIRSSVACAAICLSLLTFGGCAGNDTVVHVDGAKNASIGNSTVDHWMRSMVGADFREAIGVQGPSGFASEPADYSRCIDAAKLVGPRSFFNQLRPGRPYLERTCRALYRSVKAQALDFLIAVQWAQLEGVERGVKVTDAELKRAFQQTRKRRYPTEGDLHRYLAERQWSLADLLYRLKHELLLKRLGPISGADTGEANARMVARTRCAAHDLVPGCSGYRGPAAISPSPGAILRRLVKPG